MSIVYYTTGLGIKYNRGRELPSIYQGAVVAGIHVCTKAIGTARNYSNIHYYSSTLAVKCVEQHFTKKLATGELFCILTTSKNPPSEGTHLGITHCCSKAIKPQNSRSLFFFPPPAFVIAKANT